MYEPGADLRGVKGALDPHKFLFLKIQK